MKTLQDVMTELQRRVDDGDRVLESLAEDADVEARVHATDASLHVWMLARLRNDARRREDALPGFVADLRRHVDRLQSLLDWIEAK